MGVRSACLQACGTPSDANLKCFENCFSDAHWSKSELVLPVYGAVLAAAGLLCFSALFNGLTLGLLSLDPVGLRILQNAGEPKEQRYAAALIPVRKHGNRLLCTLLLGSTLMNSAVSILLADVTTGWIGLVASTGAILLLGEIIPQASISRHNLKVGYHTLWLTRFFLVVFYPIAWPISRALDWALGHDIGTVYSKEELKRLIGIHVEDPDAAKESGLTAQDHRLLMGVFEYKDKRVRDVMTPLDVCFMLEKSTKLDFDTMTQIYISGFSRIPVYAHSPSNIIGILFVKDLILVDPDDQIEIAALLSMRSRKVGHVADDCKLEEVFTKFIGMRQHMLIAHAAPCGAPDTAVTQAPMSGLITMEDVVEEMINLEIYDESDQVNSGGDEGDVASGHDQQGKGPRPPLRGTHAHRQEVAAYLNMLEHRAKGPRMSPAEASAVQGYLAYNQEEFRPLLLSDTAFKGLLRTATLLEQSPPSSDVKIPHSVKELWELAGSVPYLERLYQRGTHSPYFTLVLQGRVLLRMGAERFSLELGAWSVLGNHALVQDDYIPDFDAIAVAPFRLLHIHRSQYLAACDAVRLEQAREVAAVKQQVRLATQPDGTPRGLEAMSTGRESYSRGNRSLAAAAFRGSGSKLDLSSFAGPGSSMPHLPGAVMGMEATAGNGGLDAAGPGAGGYGGPVEIVGDVASMGGREGPGEIGTAGHGTAVEAAGVHDPAGVQEVSGMNNGAAGLGVAGRLSPAVPLPGPLADGDVVLDVREHGVAR